MQKFAVRITGVTPLLMHRDDVDWADEMDRWQRDPKNKNRSKRGDDRTPAFRWIGYLHHDGERICVPQEGIMAALFKASKDVPTGGARGKTFKELAASTIIPAEAFFPLVVPHGELPVEPIFALREIESFAEHVERVEKMGFRLDVRRAAVGSTKHVRVRPRFDQWQCDVVLLVSDTMTAAALPIIAAQAGNHAGLGEWRPSSPKKPGPFGRFSVEIEEI